MSHSEEKTTPSPPKKRKPKPLHSLPVTHRGVSYENRFFYKSLELFRQNLLTGLMENSIKNEGQWAARILKTQINRT